MIDHVNSRPVFELRLNIRFPSVGQFRLVNLPNRSISVVRQPQSNTHAAQEKSLIERILSKASQQRFLSNSEEGVASCERKSPRCPDWSAECCALCGVTTTAIFH
jgi:hypothetical protein